MKPGTVQFGWPEGVLTMVSRLRLLLPTLMLTRIRAKINLLLTVGQKTSIAPAVMMVNLRLQWLSAPRCCSSRYVVNISLMSSACRDYSVNLGLRGGHRT